MSPISGRGWMIRTRRNESELMQRYFTCVSNSSGQSSILGLYKGGRTAEEVLGDGKSLFHPYGCAFGRTRTHPAETSGGQGEGAGIFFYGAKEGGANATLNTQHSTLNVEVKGNAPRERGR